jgi:hypothetical protein
MLGLRKVILEPTDEYRQCEPMVAVLGVFCFVLFIGGTGV